MTKITAPTTPSTAGIKRAPLSPVKDAGAAAELSRLSSANPGKGSISGKEMAEAIFNATKDPDNQAAGKEFTTIKNWVKTHGDKLSPEAKKVFEVYSREANKAKAAGQTGIDFRVFNQMQREMNAAAKPQYKDASAGQQLTQLAAGNTKPGSISGKEMMDAIIKGTADLDGQSAGKEFADISKFVKENGQLLSPEAKKVFDVYAKSAKAAQAHGDKGMPVGDFNRMTRDMLRAATPNYKDLSAGAQLNALSAGNKEPGSISGKEMMDAIIKGTADLDGQSTRKEYGDIAKFVKENEQLLSPEAKAAFNVYEKHVKAAQGSKTGSLGLKEFMKMQGEMAKAAAPRHADASMGASLNALAAGNKEPGSISGAELAQALMRGAADGDNHAAGAEFRDAAKFVKENAHLLSPEAKAAFAVYQRHAAAAQAKGQTGMSQLDFARMGLEMARAGAPRYGDQSAAQALNGLAAGNKLPGSISGNEMMQAITNGTKDLDGQAAGKEFADIAKFVKENGQLLSPQAKATFAIYEKYAKAAQAKGQTGLNASDTWRMNLEMKQVNTPFFPFQNPAAQLGSILQGGNVSGQQIGAALGNGLDQIQNNFGQLGSILPGSQNLFGAQNLLAQLGAELTGQLLNGVAQGIMNALNNAFVAMGGAPAGEKDPLHLGEALADFQAQVRDMINSGIKPPPGNTGIVPPWMRGGDGNNIPPWKQWTPPIKVGGGDSIGDVGFGPGVGGNGGFIPPWKHLPIPFLPRPDAGATAAVNDLLKNNPKPGSISGKEMTEAIIKGTADLDNQAAGKEFAAFKEMVAKHGDKLSPEAKAAFAIYERHARSAQAKGQTGIDLGDYTRMQLEMRAASGPKYADAGAGAQLNALAANNKTPGSISGKEMVDAIIKGTVDHDNQAAGREYKDIAKFVKENEQLLSPEAKKAFAIYEGHAKAAQARGQTGIDMRDFMRMEGQLEGISRPAYQDATAAATLTQLGKDNPKAGSISGSEMTDAIIKATRDPDNQAAGREYADIAKFVKENGQLLSPEAKAAFATYERHAKAAQARGQTGIGLFESLRMNAEMRQVSSPHYQDKSMAQQLTGLANGNKVPGSISGEEMAQAILRGTRDPDNQAAGKEFADVAKFVKENEQLLSPEAKRAFATYEAAAKTAKAKGQTGIGGGDWVKLTNDLNRVSQPGYQDAGAAAALKALSAGNKAPGSISATEMRDAILRGTRDPDSQAAGKEFADFAKFAKENSQLLSPAAKKVFEVYEKAAKAAQAKGQTGIDMLAYSKMTREMMILSLFK